MDKLEMSRRDYLGTMGKGVMLAATAAAMSCAPGQKVNDQKVAEESKKEDMTPPPEHERRIQWWREAKFGMFIHWGLYSLLGRHEWAMEIEGIPVPEYEQL